MQYTQQKVEVQVKGKKILQMFRDENGTGIKLQKLEWVLFNHPHVFTCGPYIRKHYSVLLIEDT